MLSSLAGTWSGESEGEGAAAKAEAKAQEAVSAQRGDGHHTRDTRHDDVRFQGIFNIVPVMSSTWISVVPWVEALALGRKTREALEVRSWQEY